MEAKVVLQEVSLFDCDVCFHKVGLHKSFGPTRGPAIFIVPYILSEYLQIQK